MSQPRVVGVFDTVTDPCDLDSVRAAIAAAPDAERLTALDLERLVIGPEATAEVVEVVASVVTAEARAASEPARVLLLVDDTLILRDGADLKSFVEAALAERFEVRRKTLVGQHGHLAADDTAIDAAVAAIAATQAQAVVTIGGGTITDIGKVASFRSGSIPIIVVQTAASVDGFTDNVSVVLRDGVKRTIPSRWPTVVLADTTTIAGAPRRMNTAGLGELISLFTAPLDWQLATELGLDDSFHATPRDLLLGFVGDPRDWAAGLGDGASVPVTRLTEMLAIRGIGTGIAGSTACLSGVEHVVSHMLDMYAGAHELHVGLHGEQVGVATVVEAAIWELLLARLEAGTPVLSFPEPASLEARVRGAFERVDASGRQGGECWNDFASKLERWNASRERATAFMASWPELASEYRDRVPSPEVLAQTLRMGGAAALPEELEDWIDAGHFRWAVANCLFMRNRFTVVDLLFHLGWWTDAEVDLVLARARAAVEAVLV